MISRAPCGPKGAAQFNGAETLLLAAFGQLHRFLQGADGKYVGKHPRRLKGCLVLPGLIFLPHEKKCVFFHLVFLLSRRLRRAVHRRTQPRRHKNSGTALCEPYRHFCDSFSQPR